MKSVITLSNFTLTTYIDWDLSAQYLLLCLPGFLDSGNYAHMQAHRAYFAERGYLCVSFDPPGTFASPWDTSQYSVTNYLRCIHELITIYGNRPTIVLGHSLWGSMALLASFENDAIIKTISIMSPCDLKKRFEEYIWSSWQQTGERTGERVRPNSEKIRHYHIWYQFVEDALQYTMKTQLSESTKPKLFIAWTEDTIRTAISMQEWYELAWAPKSFHTIASDHNYRLYPEAIQQVNTLVEQFILENVAWDLSEDR